MMETQAAIWHVALVDSSDNEVGPSEFRDEVGPSTQRTITQHGVQELHQWMARGSYLEQSKCDHDHHHDTEHDTDDDNEDHDDDDD